jgi:polyisoprenoid-binding protein YceI
VVTGQFTLHGVTKPAKVSYRVTRKGESYAVQGDFTVDLQNFQIKKPCYLGVCVENEVKVSAEFVVH